MIFTGAAIIVIASTLAGWELALRLERRTVLLRHMNTALETLGTEVSFAMRPLADVLNQISLSVPSPAADFFKKVEEKIRSGDESAEEAWKTSLIEWMKQVDLDRKDIEILKQFGDTLGKHDLQGQLRQIQLTRTYLSEMERNSSDNQKKFQSMYRSLGLLGGLLLVIMLL